MNNDENKPSLENVQESIYALLAMVVIRAGGELTIENMEEFNSVDFDMEIEASEGKTILRATCKKFDFRVPRIYAQPYGHPFYWGDEVTDTLPAAVRAFLSETIGNGETTAEQIRLVIDYIQYFLDAPAFNPTEGIEDLRRQAAAAKTPLDARAIIVQALAAGLDPL